jgi:hypothetical protein
MSRRARRAAIARLLLIIVGKTLGYDKQKQ